MGREIEIERLIAELSDVICDLGGHRLEASDGISWISLDAALCGLHHAVIALEELRADRRREFAQPLNTTSG